MHEISRKGSEVEERTMNIYFKRPRFIRMDVLAGNRAGDAGGSGVYRNDGKVTGRKGGFFSFLSATVDKHNPQVTSIRGMTIDQIDLQATLEKLLLRLSTSASSIGTPDSSQPAAYRACSPCRCAEAQGTPIRTSWCLSCGSRLPYSPLGM